MPEVKSKPINIKSVLFYVMIIIIIFLAIYLIWFTKTDGYKCINSPLTFGVAHLQSSSNYPVTCTCSAVGSNQNLIVTKDNISYSNYGTFSLPKVINS